MSSGCGASVLVGAGVFVGTGVSVGTEVLVKGNVVGRADGVDEDTGFTGAVADTTGDAWGDWQLTPVTNNSIPSIPIENRF